MEGELKFLLNLVKVSGLLFLVACGDPHVKAGKETFARYCAPCHGVAGAGDGYNAKNLDPHARDLTDKTEPYMAKLSNQDIYDVISKGGAGVDLAPTMPTFGKVFSEEEIWSLVAYVRTLHPGGKEKPVKFDEAKPYSAKRPHVKPVSEAEFVALMEQKAADETAKEELVGTGADLFEEYGCIGCHRIRGKGGELGPNLSRAGFMLQPQFIYRWILNPQSFKPKTRMPNLGLPEEDALAVTLYLSTLKDPPFGPSIGGADISGQATPGAAVSEEGLGEQSGAEVGTPTAVGTPVATGTPVAGTISGASPVIPSP